MDSVVTAAEGKSPGEGPLETSSWDAQPVRDRALRHSVREHVLAAIQSGRLAPGERVHETSLARALDVSLSPVREALFRLADQGLLEHRPRRGFYVRTLTEAGTWEIYTFRALLEGHAARIVTERWAAGIPPEDQPGLAQMEAHIAAGERSGRAGDRLAVGIANARFHDTLIQLARHSLLRRSWSLLAPAEWLLLPTLDHSQPSLSRETVDDWVGRHRRVLDLLQSGDPAAAEQDVAEHIRAAGEGNIRRRFASQMPAESAL
jgi:DNA-binding GntR family transcriptional regulator